MKYILLLLLSQTLYASGSHHEPERETKTTTILTGQGEGVALGIAASQHHFDFGTHSWQGSIGVGSYDSNSAISFGVAKRLDRVLINGSVSTEDGITGYGAGVNWRF